MNFNAYQKEARKTAIYPAKDRNIIYPTLGLCGEAGEVAEKVKKVLRDNAGHFDKERVEELRKELGDVLWYIANISSELGIKLESVATANLKKLAARKKNGTLRGSGDHR